MKIRTIVIIILSNIIFIFFTSLSTIILYIKKIEEEKLNAISSRIVRVLSNEVLLGNRNTLEFTVEKLKKLYKLKELSIKSENKPCGYINISCITTNTTMINPELYIKIEGNIKLKESISIIFILNIIAIFFVFFYIIFILIFRINKPIEEISNSVMKQIKSNIKKNKDIKIIKNYKIKEINDIYENLSRMGESIRNNIEIYNKNKMEIKIYESIANSAKIFAHDVRKPFSIIKSLNEIIINENDEKKVKSLLLKSMPIINEARISVDILIDDTLDFGKNIKLNLELEDPKKIIQVAVDEINFSVDTKNLLFIIENNSNKKLMIDKYRILRVLRNLIFNAYQAMNYQGTITITTNDILIQNDNYLEFRIKNNNSWIDESNIEKLFDLYYSNNKKNGNGLGLYICKQIIELHNGRIRCESKKPNEKDQYVEFIFTIPSTKNQDLSILI